MATPAQQSLIDRIRLVLEKDARVEALWLSGSLGRREGDAFSDVDMLVLCADGKGQEVSASYGADVSAIAKPVLVNVLFGGYVVNVVTEDWERFDLAFTEAASLPRFNATQLTPLFNRSGREPPRLPLEPYRIKPDALLKTVNEFLRVIGLTVVGAGRAEWLLGLTGIDLLRRMTMDLMLAENGIDPARGALHRNPLLTDEQRRALESLPPALATRESVIEGQTAVAAIFLPRARRLARDIGMNWPEAFEAATRRHLRTGIGLELP